MALTTVRQHSITSRKLLRASWGRVAAMSLLCWKVYFQTQLWEVFPLLCPSTAAGFKNTRGERTPLSTQQCGECTPEQSSRYFLTLCPTLPHGKARGPQNQRRIQTACLAFILYWPFTKECCQYIVMSSARFTTDGPFQQWVRTCFITSKGHLDLASHSQAINFWPQKKKATVKDFEVLGIFEDCQNKKWFPCPLRISFTLSQVNNSTWKIPAWQN